jgi:hypothetical protein
LLTSTFDSGKPQAAGFKAPYAAFPTSLVTVHVGYLC